MSTDLRGYQLTLLGRSLLLIGLEIFANVVCWVVAVILFRPHTSGDAGGLLSLAMLSWVCKNNLFTRVSD
jgi:high-affinity nickel-transport protein